MLIIVTVYIYGYAFDSYVHIRLWSCMDNVNQFILIYHINMLVSYCSERYTK